MQKPWEIDLEVYENEAELIEGLKKNDKLACTCLLKHYAPRLYRLALNMMADRDEAEDVLQEAMINACRKIDSFEGRSSLGSWLHRIVVNTALMKLRKQTNAPEQLTTEEPQTDVWSSTTRPIPEPDHEALTSELRAKLDRAITALPETLRTAFVLRDIEGLSTQEAANILNISESALKVRLYRARTLLRDQLESYLNT